MKKEAAANVRQMRQTTQFSCVAASVASALNACGKNVTEEDVNKVMGAAPMQGASWEQALATVQYFGCRGVLVVPATLNMLKTWTDQGIPVVIAYNFEDRPWSHASVVFDVKDDGTVLVMDPNIPDPNETTRVIPKELFYKKWAEKVSDSLIIRRPAMAVMLEVDKQGRQVIASRPGPHWNPWPQRSDSVLDGNIEMLEFMVKFPQHLSPHLDLERYEVDGDKEKTLLILPKLIAALKRKDQQASKQWAHKVPKAYSGIVSSPIWSFILDGRMASSMIIAKTPQPVQQKKPKDNKIVIPGDKPRNDAAKALKDRGGGGGGVHHNREKDFEKGQTRKPKHKTDWRDKEASVDRLTNRYMESKNV